MFQPRDLVTAYCSLDEAARNQRGDAAKLRRSSSRLSSAESNAERVRTDQSKICLIGGVRLSAARNIISIPFRASARQGDLEGRSSGTTR